MSNNREERKLRDTVHLYLAINREGTAKDKRCIRTVIKDEEFDLKMLEAKLKVIGGTWRIHRTVNARNCEVARKILLKMLIDHPEKASVIDSEWRTALMQRECKETKYFMFDVDTQDEEKIYNLIKLINKNFNQNEMKGIRTFYKTPKGYHYITDPFDTREICKLDYITLLRDGYYYVKTVGKKDD